MCWAFNHQNIIEIAQGHISLSTGTTDIAAANEDEEPFGELVTRVSDTAAANEEPFGELVTRAQDLAAANEAQHTTATSPPRSVKWVVKKITPKKKLKNRV
jgi:hypothetical protein